MSPEKNGSDRSPTAQTLFYDTYALYAIAVGQKNYLQFSYHHHIITSIMNLYELYYSLLRDGKRELADAFVLRLLGCCQPITPEVIKKSSYFRILHIKKELSYIDCLGYLMALELHIPFLTGDSGFRGMAHTVFLR